MNPLEKTIYTCPQCQSHIPYLDKTKHFLNEHSDDIISLYKTHTIKQISVIFGCTSEPIRKALLKLNQIHHIDDDPDIDKRIYDLHVKQKKTITEISRLICFDIKTLKDFMIRRKIPITIYQNEVQKGIQDNHDTKKRISDLYKTKSVNEIAQIYNCSYDCVYSFMKRNKIKRRPSIEATSIAKRFYVKQYILPSGKKVNIQSKNEKMFLDYIFKNHIFNEDDFDFKYKGHSFTYHISNTKKHYFPDFYLPKYNLFIEIKTEWSLNRQGGNIVQDLKQKAVTSAGFKYLLILDNNFSVLDNSSYTR